ncbi:MAG: zinc ABC transporter substrate-binding protein [Jannaschia sp.]
MLTRIFLLSAILAGPAVADVPRVATDILPVHGLVSRVMAGIGEPVLVVPPNASPHGYAMRPSEARALEQADLIVWVGPDLTPWLEDAVATLAADAKSLRLLAVAGTHLLSFGGDHADAHGDGHTVEEDHAEYAGHDHDGEAHADQIHSGGDEDHADEHDHAGGTDPHAWLDPDNGALWLGALAEALAELDPENAGTYRANAAAGQAEIAVATTEAESLIAPAKDRAFLTFHDAYGYFEERFDVPSSGSVRLGDATSPGAASLAALRDRVVTDGIVCLFSEPQFDPGLAGAVIEDSDAEISVLDPIGLSVAPGPDFYPNFIKGLAVDMTGCLTR